MLTYSTFSAVPALKSNTTYSNEVGTLYILTEDEFLVSVIYYTHTLLEIFLFSHELLN